MSLTLLLNAYTPSLEENTAALATQTLKIDEYLKTMEELTMKNKALEERCVTLENHIEEAEQYSRKNCVEIHGVPEGEKENTAGLLDLVKKVGDAVGMEISEAMVDACHRFGIKKTDGGPRGIIVKFVWRLDKDNLRDKKRGKRNLSTRHMGLPVDKPVYVNESLTKTRRRLYGMARKFKSDNNWKFVWHRGGKIFLKKDKGA